VAGQVLGEHWSQPFDESCISHADERGDAKYVSSQGEEV